MNWAEWSALCSFCFCLMVLWAALQTSRDFSNRRRPQ